MQGFPALENVCTTLESEISNLFISSLDSRQDPAKLRGLENRVNELGRQINFDRQILDHQKRSYHARISDMNSYLEQTRQLINNFQSFIEAPPAPIAMPMRAPAKVDVPLIRETFYTAILEVLYDVKWNSINQDRVTESEFYNVICSLGLIKILKCSSRLDGIALLKNQILTVANCPEGEFQQLLKAMMGIKKVLSVLTLDQVNQLETHCITREYVYNPEMASLLKGIQDVTAEITKKDLFKNLVSEVISLSGVQGIKFAKVQAPINDSIPEGLIQKTFYNAIPSALESIQELQLITQDDILDQNSFIFGAISSLALLKVIEFSNGCNKSLRLMEGKQLTVKNCPEDFGASFARILSIKEKIEELDKEQTLILWTACVGNPEKEIPKSKDSEKVLRLAGVINSVSSEISQIEKFKKNAPQVLEIVKIFASISPPPVAASKTP